MGRQVDKKVRLCQDVVQGFVESEGKRNVCVCECVFVNVSYLCSRADKVN